MKTTIAENGGIEISEMYNGVTVMAADGSKLIIHSRDNGLEVRCVTDKTNEFSNNKYKFSQAGPQNMAFFKKKDVCDEPTVRDVDMQSPNLDSVTQINYDGLTTEFVSTNTVLKNDSPEDVFNINGIKELLSRKQYKVCNTHLCIDNLFYIDGIPYKEGDIVHGSIVTPELINAYANVENPQLVEVEESDDTFDYSYVLVGDAILKVGSQTTVGLTSIHKYLHEERKKIYAKWRKRTLRNEYYIEGTNRKHIPYTELDKAEIVNHPYKVLKDHHITFKTQEVDNEVYFDRGAEISFANDDPEGAFKYIVFELKNGIIEFLYAWAY